MAQISDENLNKLLDIALQHQKGQSSQSSSSQDNVWKLKELSSTPNLAEYYGKGMLNLFANSNPITALLYKNAELIGNTAKDIANLFNRKKKTTTTGTALIKANEAINNTRNFGDNARIFIGENSYSSFGDRANVRLGDNAMLDSRGAMYARVVDLHTQSQDLHAISDNSMLRAKNALVYADNVIVVQRTGGQGGADNQNGSNIRGLLTGAKQQLIGHAQDRLVGEAQKLLTSKNPKLLTSKNNAMVVSGKQLPSNASKTASVLSKGMRGLGTAMRGLGMALSKLATPAGLIVLGIGALAIAILGLVGWLKNMKKHDGNSNPTIQDMPNVNGIYTNSPTDNLKKLDQALGEKQYWSKNDIAVNYGDKLADGSTANYTEYNTKEKQPVFSPIAGHVANGLRNDFKPEYRKSNQIGVWGTKGNYCVKIVDKTGKSGIVIEGLMEVVVHPNQVIKKNQNVGFATDKVRVYSVKNFTSMTVVRGGVPIIDNNFATQDAEKQNFKNAENNNIKVPTGFRGAETYAQAVNVDAYSDINDYQRDKNDPTKASGHQTWDSMRSMGLRGGLINATEMGKRKIDEKVNEIIDGKIQDTVNGFGSDSNSVQDKGNKNATKASADADKLVAMNAENLAKMNTGGNKQDKIAQAPIVAEQGSSGSILMFGIDDDHANISIYGGYTDVGLTV